MFKYLKLLSTDALRRQLTSKLNASEYNDRLNDIGIKYGIVGHSLKFRFMKSLIEWGKSTIIAE